LTRPVIIKEVTIKEAKAEVRSAIKKIREEDRRNLLLM
jgi:hypothetical protein